MRRLNQGVLIVSTVLGSWFGMQAVHETGHVLGAWLTGGRVAKILLYPFTISRTDLEYNPVPLVVVWAGPIFGALLPLVLWGTAVRLRLAITFVLRFFAGFCLVANGAYIALGSFGRVGDCGEMLRHGSSVWALWLFGAVSVPTGLWLWHRQGPHFGFGAARGQVDGRVVYPSLAALVLLLVLGLVVNGK